MPFDVHRFEQSEWVLKQTTAGFRLWCSLDERAISRPILLNRYELAEAAFIEKNVFPGDLVVDAGANIGFHALHLASRVGAAGKVYAFEPLGYIADALAASIAENGFSSRVTLHRIGLDETPGQRRLRHAPRTENFGGAHFATADPLPGGHADETVETAALDDIIGDGPCAFLKMDVEGAEARVLRGARNMLAQSRPRILCELHDGQLRKVSQCSATDLIEQMKSSGYRCFELNPAGDRGSEIMRYAELTPINVIFEFSRAV